jgi:hypothetical protein
VKILRILLIFSHFVTTTILYWTRFDSIGITLAENADLKSYHKKENNYLALISLNLILLIVQSLFYGNDGQTVKLSGCIHLILDAAATFFNLWIALDGLDWQTFIYIFIFCTLVPTLFDCISTSRYLFLGIYVKSRESTPILKQIYYYWKKKN